MDSTLDLEKYISYVLNSNMNYFSSMMSDKDLGRLIAIANQEQTDEMKGKRFIEMLNF